MSKDVLVIVIDMLDGAKRLNDPNERLDVIDAVVDILDKEVKRDD